MSAIAINPDREQHLRDAHAALTAAGITNHLQTTVPGELYAIEVPFPGFGEVRVELRVERGHDGGWYVQLKHGTRIAPITDPDALITWVRELINPPYGIRP